jgi:hypothetical protein
MLTVNARWRRAYEKARPKPVLLFTLTVGSAVHRWVSGAVARFNDAVIGLAKLESTGSRLDALLRTMTIGSITLTFSDDGKLRRLGASTVLKGQRVRIDLGEDALVEADYIALCDNWTVDDVLAGAPGSILVPVTDPFGFGIDDDLQTYWHPDHPLKVAANILAAVTPSDAVNDSTMDPTLYTDTSHFIVGRPDQNDRATGIMPWFKTIDKRGTEKAFKQVRDLGWLLYGGLLPGEPGKIRFFKYDRTASTVRNLTAHDIADFQQLKGSADTIINRCTIVGRDKDGNAFNLYKANDTASQTAHGFPLSGGGTSPRIYERAFPAENSAHPWLNAVCRPPLDATLMPTFDGGDTTLVLEHAGYMGFCGTRLEDGAGNELTPYSTPSQRPEHQLSAGRPAYFLLTNHDPGNLAFEIVKCTTPVSVIASPPLTYNQVDNFDTPLGLRKWWSVWSFTVARGQLGTAARSWTHDAAHLQLFVYDITIPVFVAQQLIDRCSYGCPEVEFRVPIRHHDLQHGDLISFPRRDFIHYNVNGATASTLWEIIGKDPAYFGKNPGYKLLCAFARQGAVQPLVPVTVSDPEPSATTEQEFYFDATGAIYTDDSGSPYFGPPRG